jgi:hypothetical protein
MLILPRRVTVEELVAPNDEVHQRLVNDQDMMYNIAMRRQEQINLTKAGDNAAQNAEVLVKVDKEGEDWVNRKWRPAMGWMYMAVCITDFILFPVLWSILQALSKGQVTSQWQPLTLQGAGLFHLAMGAVLGIAVYGRTKEKLDRPPIINQP